VATEAPRSDVEFPRSRPPVKAAALKAAAVLLSLYIAMHLAVGGLVHVLAGPGAAAATTPESLVAIPSAYSTDVGVTTLRSDVIDSKGAFEPKPGTPTNHP
jgi:hypothetical protein